MAQALDAGRPVVALSPIASRRALTRRTCRPRSCSRTEVRAHGAVPATIAIVGGRLKAGLSAEAIEQLGRAGEAIKVSRRDIPFRGGGRRSRRDHVAATMIVAATVGIRIFATGIGGVHRGAPQTSTCPDRPCRSWRADAGGGGRRQAPSILDLRLTLEYLRPRACRGRPVVGLLTDERAPWSLPTGHRARAAREVGASGPKGMVIAPVSAESHAIAAWTLAISQALAEAEAQGIAGQAPPRPSCWRGTRSSPVATAWPPTSRWCSTTRLAAAVATALVSARSLSGPGTLRCRHAA